MQAPMSACLTQVWYALVIIASLACCEVLLLNVPRPVADSNDGSILVVLIVEQVLALQTQSGC